MQLTHSSECQPRWRIGYVRTYGEVSSKPRHNDGSIPLHTAINKSRAHTVVSTPAIMARTMTQLRRFMLLVNASISPPASHSLSLDYGNWWNRSTKVV